MRRIRSADDSEQHTCRRALGGRSLDGASQTEADLRSGVGHQGRWRMMSSVPEIPLGPEEEMAWAKNSTRWRASAPAARL